MGKVREVRWREEDDGVENGAVMRKRSDDRPSATTRTTTSLTSPRSAGSRYTDVGQIRHFSICSVDKMRAL